MSRTTSKSQPKPTDPRKTPFGPRGHWLFGTMPQVAGDPLGLYESAWKRYGDIVRLRALPGVYFFLLGVIRVLGEGQAVLGEGVEPPCPIKERWFHENSSSQGVQWKLL